MSTTLYDGSIVVAIGALESLSHILTVAEAHKDAASFPSARLYEDMQPLTFQVDTATDVAQITLARLTGTTPIEYEEDSLVTFADMQTRIKQVIELLKGANKDSINDRASAPVRIGMGPGEPAAFITTKSYAYATGIPNIYFHLTIAYAILRSRGVPLGKGDFIESFVNPHITHREE